MINKIPKLLRIMGAMLRHPGLLRRVLEDDNLWRTHIRKTHRIDHPFRVITLNDLFSDFSQAVITTAFLDGSSLPADLALLKSLAAGIKGCRYFEIGTWRGESVVNVAEAASDCYTLNLSAEDMHKLQLPEDYIRLHGFFSKGKPNITHLEGDSRTFDFAGLNQKFDLVFIDGDHHHDFVKNDTEQVFKHLVHPGSIVVWHDYAFNPEKVRFEVMAGILDGIPVHLHQNLYHVSNTLCAIYLPENIRSRPFYSPVTPEHWFKVSIELNS